ncbi:MAG: LPS export ABC transporter permease LptF [Pseudomonadota bacterium]|nr:LPS export ABC transporter permease LptF [Pseudomonadota bacterium]
MLFDSTLRKELGRSFGATLVVLITIVMTVMLIRTLGQASIGRINPQEVMLVMGYTVLGQLSAILSLSLFVAITATLTRMYASSEMVVWFSCGQGLASFLKPVLRFAWPVLLTVAVLSIGVLPWASQQVRELRDRFQGRGDIERVAPGRFIESQGGQRVFFIDQDEGSSESGSNIFITATERGTESVVTAQSGRLEVIRGERFLVLDKGHRVETALDTGATRVSEFAEYGARMNPRALGGPSTSDSPRLKSTWALLQDLTPRHQSELSWRFGLALAALNCVVIALAATRVNPRVGRSAGLIFTLFAFASYYNLLGVGQSWVGHGRITLWPLLLLLHGGIFTAAMLWLLARHGDWLSRWRLGRSAKTVGA